MGGGPDPGGVEVRLRGRKASVAGAGGSTNQAKTDSAYLRLIRRLDDAGVPLVAGTDNSLGTTYRRELEM